MSWVSAAPVSAKRAVIWVPMAPKRSVSSEPRDRKAFSRPMTERSKLSRTTPPWRSRVSLTRRPVSARLWATEAVLSAIRPVRAFPVASKAPLTSRARVSKARVRVSPTSRRLPRTLSLVFARLSISSSPRPVIRLTTRSPASPREAVMAAPRASSAPVTRSPAPVSAMTIRSDAPSSSWLRLWCEPVIAPRTRSALVTMDSRWATSSSTRERMRISLSE
jgi:hypothetical protein